MTPDPVLFVARNLDVWPVPAALAGSSLAFSTPHRPYYRLTPAVWAWLSHAVDNLAAKPAADRRQVEAGADRVIQLGNWLAAYYPPDAIQEAINSPPKLPDDPAAIPDRPTSTAGGFVSRFCPLSVGPARAAQDADVQDPARPAAAG